ncbi:hypothetical protein [Pendulispora albinea]|uniref:Uncharacterized protein n=1 Tax=Pendulispora albinea TaxID=2741071 RepID=A0ABZ2LS36_9BACT
MFDVERDGQVFYRDETTGLNPRIAWRGHVDADAVQKVEDALRKNKFCSLKALEKTRRVKVDGFSITMRGFDCGGPNMAAPQSVALQYAAWREDPRAKAIYRAVRELMDATCGPYCPPPPQLRE